VHTCGVRHLAIARAQERATDDDAYADTAAPRQHLQRDCPVFEITSEQKTMAITIKPVTIKERLHNSSTSSQTQRPSAPSALSRKSTKTP
jgi:hypothetical protein